ncbi:MAG: ABC transporter permease [Eubacteriales bacterium]
MNEVLALTGRNIRRYFRDVGAILFSFLSVFIVAALYIFFLTDMQIESVRATVGNLADIDSVIIAWVVGGLLCIPAVSVPLFLLCFKVDDVVDGVADDLLVSPAGRFKILLGYNISAWLVGLAMTLLTFGLCEVFIAVKGGELLSMADAFRVMGVLGLMVLAFSGLFFLIILFMKKRSSVMVITSVLNTLLGFFLGLFVPVGILSENIASVIKAFPLLQGASLVRQILMGAPLNALEQQTGAAAIGEIKSVYGVTIVLNEHLLTTSDIIMILFGFAVLCYGASYIFFARQKQH